MIGLGVMDRLFRATRSIVGDGGCMIGYCAMAAPARSAPLSLAVDARIA